MFKQLRNLVALSALCCAVGAAAQPAATYYTAAALDGKTGTELELALAAIVYPHTRISYDDLWEKFAITDPGPTDSIPDGAAYSDLVYDMYAWMSRRPHYYSDGDHSQVTGINREHSLPNSWWGGITGNDMAYTDLHHLTPADGAANNAKGNYPLGTGRGVTGATSRNTENSGCKVWTIPNGTATYGTNYVWEPTDEYKGDFARMYMYVVTAYQGRINWETEYMFTSDASKNTTIKPWATELLLKWHRQDPVSDKERERNNAVASIQGNRNPYIDYPELAEYVWGAKNDTPFVLANAISSYSYEYSHPSGSNIIYYPHVARLGTSFAAPTLKTNSDGAMSYASSNPAVATVDAETGAVTLVSAGLAKITVTQAETATYAAGTAAYYILVIE